ncbi:MAG: class I SAM-dependent methyltransferase [Pseudomonadota bacterium]
MSTGTDKRAPRRTSPTYAVRAPLLRWLREEAERTARERGSVRVLDVGSGPKPYEPLFAACAAEYVGLDLSGADLVGTVEDLPVPDASYDLVLCNQVLEHCDDPPQAVRELRRATAPGGRVLASTHGVQVYHPAPVDLWRWTHTGLERLFRSNGDWSAVTVRPGSGTAACVGMLLGTFMHLLAKRAGAPVLAKPAIAAVNAGAEALDRRVAALREPQPGTIFANYHVVAEVAP